MYLEDNPTEEEIEQQIKISEEIEQVMEQAEDNIIRLNYTWTLVHKWYPADSQAQKIVQYAYKLGWMDFVYVFECENWTYDMKRLGDNNHAHWICQMNDRFHKDIPSDFTTNWVVAVEYCYKKWKAWTPFYWPSRIMKNWQKCSDYVKSRFILE